MSPPRKILDWKLAAAASVAGLLYSSWPLGYIFNPVANRGLASNLEALAQPYNWLFILLDILSGLIVVGVAVTLYERSRGSRQWLLKWSIVGYGLFGVLTALDALLPIDCLNTVQRCGAFTGHPLIILHGLASLGSIGFLTVSLVGLWFLLIYRQAVNGLLRWLLHTLLLIWFGFGIATGIFLLNNRSSALSQHLFITVCSIWLAIFPYLVYRTVDGQRLVLKKVTIR